MACTWSPMLVYAVLGQAKWVYMSDILRLKRPIRLYVPICTTYCPFCRHIPENAPIRSTPRFCQRSLKIGRQAFPAARCQQQNEMQLISNRKVQTISSRKCAFSPAENAVIHQSMPPLPTSSRSLAKSILRCTFFRAPGQVYQDLPRRQRLTWAPLGYAHLGSEF